VRGDPIPTILCRLALVQVRLIQDTNIHSDDVVECRFERLTYWGMESDRIPSPGVSRIPVLVHCAMGTNWRNAYQSYRDAC